MAAPAKRADLVEVAHPGFRVVYYKTQDKAGKSVVVPYTMPDIDANEAVTRYPGDYSYDRPDDAGELQPPVGAHDPFAAAPAVPPTPPAASPIQSQAVGGADTSVGHGNPASGPVEQTAAARADAETQALADKLETSTQRLASAVDQKDAKADTKADAKPDASPAAKK